MLASEPPSCHLREYLKLYLILETSQLCLPLGDFIMQAVEGGVTAIQLRDKIETERSRYETARAVKSLIADKDVLFIVNNSADLAAVVGAHGVHLGLDDLPPGSVKCAFPDLIVGYSCNTQDDREFALSSGADYVGIGPAFFTATKNNLRPVLGTEGVQRLAENLPIPAVAIGGIREDNLIDLSCISISGVAISAALCQSSTPYDVAVNLRKIIDSNERV